MDIASRLKNLDKLPTLPQVTQRILEALAQDASAKELEKIIAEDQALTARLLKLANSPLYVGANPVTSLTQAIVRLGLGEVRNVVLTTAMRYVLTPTATYKKFNITRLWIHAIGVARAVYLLAQEEGMASPETCYTAGLLHDIGRLALTVFFPEEFLRILALTEAKDISFKEAEEELGLSHAEVGALVAEKWRFSEELIQAIKYHHAPKQNGRILSMAFLIFKGDIVARAVGFVPEENFSKLPKWPKSLPLNKKLLAKVVNVLKKERQDLLSFWTDVFVS